MASQSMRHPKLGSLTLLDGSLRDSKPGVKKPALLLARPPPDQESDGKLQPEETDSTSSARRRPWAGTTRAGAGGGAGAGAGLSPPRRGLAVGWGGDFQV